MFNFVLFWTAVIKLKSLSKNALASVSWTLISFGSSQILRLGSNLILTRLLVPEHFGLMAIVNIFMIAFEMFSDLGISTNIIQSPRGESKDFLNTAWTIQVIRGFVIWICCIILSFPIASFYDNHSLIKIITIYGFVSVISGFNSTNIYSAYRNLTLGRLTFLEIGSQIIAILSMLILALVSPNVWVLVFGALCGSMTKMIASHYYLDNFKNRFQLNKTAAFSLIKFGKWIFISTMLGFFLNSSASLILGKFITMSQLGIFTIGTTIAKILDQIYQKISNTVLLPTFSKIRDQPLPQLRKKVKRIKIAIISLFLPLTLSQIVFGQIIIDLLYDTRYANAGWIVQVFGIGFLPTIILAIGPFYLALGKSLILMIVTIIRFIFYLISVFLGWHLYQAEGLIIAIGCYTVLVYGVEAFIQYKHSIWLGYLDFVAISISLSVIYVGFQLVGFPKINI